MDQTVRLAGEAEAAGVPPSPVCARSRPELEASGQALAPPGAHRLPLPARVGAAVHPRHTALRLRRPLVLPGEQPAVDGDVAGYLLPLRVDVGEQLPVQQART